MTKQKKEGSKINLEELYMEIQPKIYAFFYVKTFNREIAEDLTQEVFYEAIKNGSSFEGKASIQTWIFAIAKNRLKKYFRSKKYKDNLVTRLPREHLMNSSPEEEFLDREVKNQLLEKIAMLDENAKEVVMLRIYGELSFKDIGNLLEKSENFARVTFHRAKLKLQKEMEGYHGE